VTWPDDGQRARWWDRGVGHPDRHPGVPHAQRLIADAAGWRAVFAVAAAADVVFAIVLYRVIRRWRRRRGLVAFIVAAVAGRTVAGVADRDRSARHRDPVGQILNQSRLFTISGEARSRPQHGLHHTATSSAGGRLGRRLAVVVGRRLTAVSITGGGAELLPLAGLGGGRRGHARRHRQRLT